MLIWKTLTIHVQYPILMSKNLAPHCSWASKSSSWVNTIADIGLSMKLPSKCLWNITQWISHPTHNCGNRNITFISTFVCLILKDGWRSVEVMITSSCVWGSGKWINKWETFSSKSAVTYVPVRCCVMAGHHKKISNWQVSQLILMIFHPFWLTLQAPWLAKLLEYSVLQLNPEWKNALALVSKIIETMSLTWVEMQSM